MAAHVIATLLETRRYMYVGRSVSGPPGSTQTGLPRLDFHDHATGNLVVDGDLYVTRSWAEALAEIDPDRPPGDVPLRRWMQLIDDIGHFIDRGFAKKAAALGWTALDLFGCDRDRPFARIDRAGLLWLLNGDRIMALSENTATIETRTGARQT